MIGVVGTSVADHFGVNFCAARLCVFVLFEHDDGAAFAHDKAAAFLIERNGSAVFVLRLGKRLAADKTREAQGDDRRLAAAGKHCVGIAVFDNAVSLADAVGGSCAGGYDADVRPLRVIFDRYRAGRDVRDHHRHEKGRNPAGALFDKFRMFGNKRMDTADARPDVYAETVGRNALRRHAGIFIRLRSRRDRVLRVKICFAQISLRHIQRRVKPADFPREAAFIFGSVELGHRVDAVDALFHILPSGLHVVAQGRDRPEPRYHDSFCHNYPPRSVHAFLVQRHCETP